MKKIISVFLSILTVFSCAAVFTGCSNEYADVEFVKTEYEGTTIRVYNWGENIANGEDGSKNLEKIFEKKYGIDVDYQTYASNEEMYTILSGGTVSYDLVIPSDYMIARMINEDMLQKINYENIPNYSNILDEFKVNQYFDCAGQNAKSEYSVPYTIGMVGIIYNSKYVDEADVASHSWNLLWNEKYKDKIVMIDNPRDAFGISLIKNGFSVNTTNEAEWNTAYESLVAQKLLLKGYAMDQIYNYMGGENAYVGVYYAGDCLTMLDDNKNLSFFYPNEGTNAFVDAMCIPKNAKNVGAAELFINFLLEEEYAVENSLYICYASPNKKVRESALYKEELGDDYYAILYDIPEQYKNADGSLNTKVAEYYFDLDANTRALQSELWGKVK